MPVCVSSHNSENFCVNLMFACMYSRNYLVMFHMVSALKHLLYTR